MSSSSQKFSQSKIKRNQDAAALITPPEDKNPGKVLIKTKSTPMIDTGLKSVNSPSIASADILTRADWIEYFNNLKKENKILTPTALNPLKEENMKLRSTQEELVSSFNSLASNVLTPNVLNSLQDRNDKLEANQLEISKSVNDLLNNAVSKNEMNTTKQQIANVQNSENTIKEEIKELETRFSWLSDSMNEQRVSLERRMDKILEQMSNMNFNRNDNKALQEKFEFLEKKILDLEEKLSNCMVVIERQQQIINSSEEKVNNCINVINSQQQAIDFLLNDSNSLQSKFYNNNDSLKRVADAIMSLVNSINLRSSDVRMNVDNDLLIKTPYPLDPKVDPYSGNTRDAPQFVETVRNLFKTYNFNEEKKLFFLSTHMGAENVWYNFVRNDDLGNPRTADEILDLFEETFVTKLSIQEYTNKWLNLKLTPGKEYDYLEKFKYYLSFNSNTPISVVHAVMLGQIPKEYMDEIQELDDVQRVQDLYEGILKVKRDREEKKRIDKSRGTEQKKWTNSVQKPKEETKN